ncbi:hypothetical protein EXU85_24770 [Spirosoma sp. KCTC 42546]|uniref:hypothetical protein n=1 Tax=Spirosoma sp. KCTC 42546 TaxID=2520506 RepID=UPI001157217A|nr:hypothetical protein [Spirosoma sp. KCTC 42546]QDK81649.1 hypothetical protein EXU85_24770 [Spirosoma sp. KCTC 42546]
MKTKRTDILLPQHIPDPDFITITEHHLNEWLHLLDHLQDAHAPTDQLAYCRNQVTRLQLELYQLRNTNWRTTVGQPE